MKQICPQEEVLADYLAGRLSEENKTGLESHLSDCDQCLDEIMVAEELSQDNELSDFDMVPPALTESAIALVKGRIPPEHHTFRQKSAQILNRITSWISGHTPFDFYGSDNLAPVRSSEKTITNEYFHVRKSFKEIITDIEVEKTGQKKACVRVNLVSDTKNETNIRVTLLDRNEREMASFLLSGGFVLFEDIQFGHYCLAFIRNGRRIGMYQFEIKDSSYAK